jgi:hypothetical protein
VELKMTRTQITTRLIAVALLAAVADVVAQQTPPPPAGGPQDHVAALKQSLGQGQAMLRQYEWIETTVISFKGEEKSRKQNRCYYGTDGRVQKIPLDQPQPQAQAQEQGGRGGRRGGRVKEQIVEHKKDEMKEYMEDAATLIHQYVPPGPPMIQAAKDAGRISITPQAGGRVRLVISQYLQPGDSMTIDVDGTANRLLGLGVNTYLKQPQDTVTLVVQMTTLPDGAQFAGQTTLDAKAKNIQVVITNSGHRPVGR